VARALSRLSLVLALALAAAPLASLLVGAHALARPGGGQSFGGSKSSPSRSTPSRSSGSSFGGSSRSSTPSRSSDSSWSKRPSYSFPTSPSSGSSPSSPSSSRGSSGSGSSGAALGGSMGEFFFFLLVGGVVLALGVVVVVRVRDGWSQGGWESGLGGSLHDAFDEVEADERAARDAEEARRVRYRTVAEALAHARSRDEAFSQVLFEDFLYALYAETQMARGKGTLALLEPYVAEHARAAYDVYPVKGLSDVIVGSMRIDSAAARDDRALEVAVTFEANLTEVHGDGASYAFYVREHWTLERPADARSRPPEQARVIGCANCGAPLDKVVGKKCRHCDAVVGEGDWRVTSIRVAEREARGPILTGTTEEVGTNLPTVVAPDAKERYEELLGRDPELEWAAFLARVELVFHTFHEAWTKQEPLLVRPYLSDGLYQVQLYWVDAYKKQRLRNVTEDARIVTVHMARVVHDAYFDAITLRVYATCRDYTLDAEGEVVGGSRSKPRNYSEYWTLIRAAKAKGKARVERECPNCGAALDVNMAGHCTSCGVAVTTGDFDWVLSRIEQDEVYEG
jgi:hypothetical protein